MTTGQPATPGIVPGLTDPAAQAVQNVTGSVLGTAPSAGTTPATGAPPPTNGAAAAVPPAAQDAPPPGQPTSQPTSQPTTASAPQPGAAPGRASLLGDVLGVVDQVTGLVVAPAAQPPSSGQPAGATPNPTPGQPPPGGESLLGATGPLAVQPAGTTTAASTLLGQTLNVVLTLPVVNDVVAYGVRPVLSSPLLRPLVLPVVAGLTWVAEVLPARLGLGPVLSDLGGVLGLPLYPGGSLVGAGPGAGSARPAAGAPAKGLGIVGHLVDGGVPGSLPVYPSPSSPANGGGGAGSAFAVGNALVLGWAAMFVAFLLVAGLRRQRPGAPRPLPRILFASLTERPG